MFDRTRIIVDGQEYGGVEEMPPAVREFYHELMGSVGRRRRGQRNPEGEATVELMEDGVVFRSAGRSVRIVHESGRIPEVPAPRPKRRSRSMLTLLILFVCVAAVMAVALSP